MRNAGLEEAQAEIKVAGRNINNFRYEYNTTLMTESEEELKSLLMKVKEKNAKVGFKFTIQKMKIMASSPITSWQTDGETVSDFIFWGSKITADGNCSHEKTLTPWKESYDGHGHRAAIAGGQRPGAHGLFAGVVWCSWRRDGVSGCERVSDHRHLRGVQPVGAYAAAVSLTQWT